MAPPLPWVRLHDPSPDREYVFLASYLPLKRLGQVPRFMRYSQSIRGQLQRTEGAIGYSLRAKILRRDFWTLSVWESEEALRQFVRADPHGGVMRSLVPHMGPTKFVRWKAQGSEVPPSWDEADRRMSAEEGEKVSGRGARRSS
jgi:hypothetical protein